MEEDIEREHRGSKIMHKGGLRLSIYMNRFILIGNVIFFIAAILYSIGNYLNPGYLPGGNDEREFLYRFLTILCGFIGLMLISTGLLYHGIYFKNQEPRIRSACLIAYGLIILITGIILIGYIQTYSSYW